jgi:glycosyltransferase involved in cell wall biosynthesis
MVGRTRITPTLPLVLALRSYDVYLKCTNGKFALPVTYMVARLKRKPFVLRTEIWAELQSPLHRLAAPLVRHIYRKSEAVIAYGDHVKRYLLKQGVRPERIFVAVPVVESSVYAQPVTNEQKSALRAQLGIPDGKKVVLYLGRLVESKGCKFLVEAFASLHRDDAVLVIAGDGQERAALEEQVRRHGIEGRVRFTGHVVPADTPRYFAMAYVKVLVSITTRDGREPWALVVNEAFNQGTPVIASDAVGAAAGGLVQDGRNGFVVPEQDASSLAQALRRILDDEALRDAMSRHAASTIADYTYERMAKVFADAIRYAMKLPLAQIECEPKETVF